MNMSSTSRPFFTVVVPVYNHERYIGAALDSLIAQIDGGWEAVVVDDGSTDGTAGIIDKYAEEDDRFRTIHKENGGQASALNAGVKEAKGEWICWLSSDDLFESDKLSIHREWIAKHPECRFFFTDFKTLMEDTGEIREDGSFGAIPDNPEWCVITLLEFVYINGISICVHREVFDKVGLFHEGYRYAQDYDLYMRAFVHFTPIHMPVRTCVMRSHAGQYTVTHERPMFFQCAEAAIDFINHHTFEEMFPITDLSKPNTAAVAVDRALDVAMGSHCFLYGLGAHPGLFARIIDWVDQLPGNRTWRHIRNALAIRLRAGSILCKSASLRQMCTAAFIRLEQPKRAPSYHQVTPDEVAEGLYFRLLANDDSNVEALRAFVEQYFDREFPDESVDCRLARNLLVVGRKGDDGVSKAEMIVRKGHYVTVAEVDGDGLTLKHGAVVVGCSDSFSSILSFVSVPVFDTMLVTNPNRISHWPLAASKPIDMPAKTAFVNEWANLSSPIGRLERWVRNGLCAVARARRIIRRLVG